eukprot:GHVS01001841.1.p1 GENE.GHVS01001841.1~~GHVS01001841.1.p1  ORF type:complete len:559 (-),score=55.86 GHVS01001841.1:168-1844(-)
MGFALQLSLLLAFLLCMNVLAKSTLKEIRQQLEADLADLNSKLVDEYTKPKEEPAPASCTAQDSCGLAGLTPEEPIFDERVEEVYAPLFYKGLDKLASENDLEFLNAPAFGTPNISVGLRAKDYFGEEPVVKALRPDSYWKNFDGDESTVADSTELKYTPAATSAIAAAKKYTHRKDKVKLDWDNIGTVGRPYSVQEKEFFRTLYPVEDRDTMLCARDRIKEAVAAIVNKDGKTGKETVAAEAAGFYRFVEPRSGLMVFYPQADVCPWMTPLAQPWVRKSTVGKQRVMLRLINDISLWRDHWSFGDKSTDMYYTFACEDTSRQNTKMALTFIDQMNEEDEFAIVSFPSRLPLGEKYDEDKYFSDPASLWEKYPAESDIFLTMTEENKVTAREFVTDVHQKQIEQHCGGFFDLWKKAPLEFTSRNETAIHNTALGSHIEMFEKQANATGPTCHGHIFEVSPITRTKQNPRIDVTRGALMVGLHRETDTEAAEMAWRMVTGNIAYSRVQTTYGEITAAFARAVDYGTYISVRNSHTLDKVWVEETGMSKTRGKFTRPVLT